MNPARPIHRRLLAAPLAVAAASAVASAPASALDVTPTTCKGRNGSVQTLSTAEIENTMLCMTNNERRVRGLPPLTSNPSLVDAARAHSQDRVVRNVDFHDDGLNTVDARMRAHGYQPTEWWENILTGWSTPTEGMTWWMNSPGHHDNILRSTVKEIGIGVTAAAARSSTR